MRETVLQGTAFPPPNAFGRCRNADALVNQAGYARWRTPATGGPFHMVRIVIRVGPGGRVLIGTSGFSTGDTSQLKEWLDIRRSGDPRCSVFRGNSATIQPNGMGMYLTVPTGGLDLIYPIKLSINDGVVVQSLRGGKNVNVTFYWFEP